MVPSVIRQFFLAGAAVLLGSAAFAAPQLGLVQSSYSGLNPGDEFTVQLQVLNPETVKVVAYDFFIWANDDDVFYLLSQELEAPVDLPAYLDFFPYAVTVGNEEEPVDFGAFSASLSQGFGQGTSLAQTLTFSLNADIAPGEYTLTFGWVFPVLAGPSLLDANESDYQMAQPLLVQVSVVPEPAVWGLLSGGLAVSCMFRNLRRRS